MSRSFKATKLARRELLTFLLGAPLASRIMACDRAAPNHAADLPGALLGQPMALGHRLKTGLPPDRDWTQLPTRHYDALVVGAGPAGLSAAATLYGNTVRKLAVLELDRQPGGTSQGGHSNITPYPWAAHYLTCPMAENRPLCALLEDMGVINYDSKDGSPQGRAPYVVAEPKERHYYQGFFYPGLYRYAGASAADIAELQRFENHIVDFARSRDKLGRRAFALPIGDSSDDKTWSELDQSSAKAWLAAQGYRSERLYWLLEYGCRDDFGLTLEHTSAWAMLHYHASRNRGQPGVDQPALTWPNGNQALVSHLSRPFGKHIHTGKLVIDVVDDKDGVRALVLDAQTDRLECYQAAYAIVATPHFITRRIVRALRDGTGPQPPLTHGAWLVANLHLHSRPHQRGAEQAWDTVLVESPSLGYVTATHQLGRSYGPTVWTYYLPMTDENPHMGRKKLQQPTLKDFQEAILSDLEMAHPDLRAHISRLDVYRWGHAMAQPRPGTIFHKDLAQARQPLGRVHFAHSDLSAVALFEEAFSHGRRAAQEVLARLGRTPS